MSPGKFVSKAVEKVGHSDQESGHTRHDNNAGHLNGSGEKLLEKLEFYAISHGQK